MTTPVLIIGDIGGTNARFAIANVDGPGFSGEMTLQCADFASADDAIRHYLDVQSVGTPDAVCLAAAGPVVGDTVQITNNHWTLDQRVIKADFDIDAVSLLNDFEAAAYSIPQLSERDVVGIGLPDQQPDFEADYTTAILGPGTGLGTAGLIRRGERIYPIIGEGGHVGFAPKSQVQIDVLRALRGRFDRVSVERLLSGSGIENIYWALTYIHGEQRTQPTAREIFADGGEGGDPRAIETVQLFFEVFGQVAGDLALTLGATDGVFLAGGIAKRYPAMLQNSGFRNAFDNKGRYRTYMERIPTLLITCDEPGLLGAAYCARAMLPH